MLIYWAGASQTASPRERRPIRGHGVDLTNEAQHVETHEVSVERAEEKSAVDHQDPVSSFIISHAKNGFTCSAREDVVATLMK